MDTSSPSLLNVNISENVHTYIKRSVPEIHAFWNDNVEVSWDTSAYLAHVDYIYVRTLLGTAPDLSPLAARTFAEAVGNAPLAGRAGFKKTLFPHLSAYLLGAINLLAEAGHDYRASVLGSIDLDVHSIVDRKTNLPCWPRLWSHHIWRVSHWIGGIPSILLSFARHDPRQTVSESLVRSILEVCDRHILADKTGLMRPYRSELMQSLFRMVYRLRHNPDFGDIGGLVHIHWGNHALGRPYKEVPALIKRCLNDMKQRPFLEGMPYCLDFDYIQLLRTAIEQCPAKRSEAVVERAKAYADDVVRFLANIPKGYSFHKLPGALATLHEAALILQVETVPGTGCLPVDVIKKAYWL